jgi:hypothetical protein
MAPEPPQPQCGTGAETEPATYRRPLSVMHVTDASNRNVPRCRSRRLSKRHRPPGASNERVQIKIALYRGSMPKDVGLAPTPVGAPWRGPGTPRLPRACEGPGRPIFYKIWSGVAVPSIGETT